MTGHKPQAPLYDRRRLEQLVMEHRMRMLLQKRTHRAVGAGKK